MEPDYFDKNRCTSSQCCSFEWDRRDFLRLISLGALATMSARTPLNAAESSANQDFGQGIPASKNLRPEWVKSLFARGDPEIYRGVQLAKIKMPIGGICAGSAYLTGEGALTSGRPSEFSHPFKQGFSLRTISNGTTEVHQLDQKNFPDMTFRGEYPIAQLEYTNASLPVHISLEAFSPFIPLDADDSGLPASVFHFTLKNGSTASVEASLIGSLQNAVCDYSRSCVLGIRRNRITRNPNLTALNCTAEPDPEDAAETSLRPEIIFEDWDRATFGDWKVEGTAFGAGPYERAAIDKKLGQLDGPSPRVVNSFAMSQSNAGKGKLTSKPFAIQRRFINIWIGGGDTEAKTCVNLVVGGRAVQSLTGARSNVHSLYAFDTRALEGRQATIEIVDDSEGDWGQISVGRIAFSDTAGDGTPFEELSDYGTMSLSLLGAPAEIGIANGSIGFDGESSNDATVALSKTLIGTLGRTIQLKPGESATVTFIATWYFPNLQLQGLGKVGRYYAKRFDSPQAVATYVATNFTTLADTTRLWRDTWYNSTLPYWFLDRTFLNVSTLATGGCYRLANGRFYSYESGDGCCPGTCTHVWQYAHSVSRVFPELERDTRERVDLGLALNPDTGVIGFRGELDMRLAVDGQAGTILRFYREHQMSSDGAFLNRNWAKIKSTYKPLFALDADEDGIMEGYQWNTLDHPWFGQVAWLSSMYVAALRAG